MNHFNIQNEAMHNDIFNFYLQLYINGRLFDNLISSAMSSVGVMEYDGPPCNINPCLNWGVCVPRMDQADCKCPTKFIGARCEKSKSQKVTKT